MSTVSIGFSKIKKIISNIKDEMDNFHSRLNNLSTNSSMINNFRFKKNYENNSNINNPIISNINSPITHTTNNIINNVTTNVNSLSRQEKIDLFNKKRSERMEEIKKQINFLDYIFLDDENKSNSPEQKSTKIKTIKGVLSNKEYDLNESDINSICDAIVSDDPSKKEQLLEELAQKESNVVDHQENVPDLVLTKDFLSKLKSEGKEITHNFAIKQKEGHDNPYSWLESDDLEVKSNNTLIDTNKTINKEDFISLLSKK